MEDIFVFYDPQLTDEGAENPGKIVVGQDGVGIATLTADLLDAEGIGSHVWLSY